MPTFLVDLIPAAEVTDPSVTADVETSSVTLSWTPSVGPNLFSTIVRRTIGNVTEELAVLTDAGAGGFVDYAAPLNTTVTYEIVTVNTDGVESEGVELDAVLDDLNGYWLVLAGDASRTFRVQHVGGFDETEPIDDERHRPLGRSRVLVQQGERTGSEGSITAKIFPADADVIPRIRELSDLGDVAEVLLKTPFGDVFRVALGEVRRSRLVAGIQSITFGYVEIGKRESTAGLNTATPET